MEDRFSDLHASLTRKDLFLWPPFKGLFQIRRYKEKHVIQMSVSQFPLKRFLKVRITNSEGADII